MLTTLSEILKKLDLEVRGGISKLMGGRSTPSTSKGAEPFPK